MATYKVLQDIEAEDKLLGPLTLRQFIYALVSVFFLYLCFIVITKGAPFLLAVFFPPAAFTGFFAFPFMKDQPTEVWALAKIRFLFKPRKRIWDQSGVKELVTITVPKRIERILTDGLSQNEVASRLGALANTLDSRGWAIKNVSVNMFNQSMVVSPAGVSDRLIDVNSLPRQVPAYDVQPSDDILDVSSNAVAQQFDQMINASTQAHRKQVVDQMNSEIVAEAAGRSPQDYWFMDQAQQASQGQQQTDNQVIANDTTLTASIKATKKSGNQTNSHLRTVQPIGNQPKNSAETQTPKQAQAPIPTGSQAAILSLANNNDLTVATIARQANKAKQSDELSDGEVVISLRNK